MMPNKSVKTSAPSTPPPRDGAAPQTIELTIPAQAEWVRVARLVTVGVANRLGFNYDDIEDLKLAVAEACNNAILHARPAVAYAGGDEPKVRIRHVLHADRLEIFVADEGRADEVHLPEPQPRDALNEVPTAQWPESGLGLLLIRSLMDEVQQVPEAELHTLRLVKYLSAPH
jgi:serine/threonine-protein kinase RsbW